MGKPLKYLVIHCTATPEGREVTAADIERWHLGGRGWSRVGYSDLIDLHGRLINLVPFNSDGQIDVWEISNGARGINGVSRHVVYAGGCDRAMKPEDTRTPEQKTALADYVRYMVRRHPGIQVAGHYHFSSKACPSFKVEDWCEEIFIPEKNIFRS